MTTISGVIPTSSVPNVPITENTNANRLSTDFETYLQMLTVQMENQDPLDPTDASEFSLQLATFSALEQQVFTNQLLQQMLPGTSDINNIGMLEALGRKAFVEGDAIFKGNPIELRIPELPAHGKSELKIQDEFGGTIATKPITNDVRSLAWSADGNLSMNEGSAYRFLIETHVEGEPMHITQVLTPQTVMEVIKSGSGFDLILEDGTKHRADAVYGFME